MSAAMAEAIDLAHVLATTGEARRLRLAAELSLGELATVADVPMVDAARWEHGCAPEGDEAADWGAVVDLLADAEARDMPARRGGART